MNLFTMFDPLYWLLITPAMLLALWAQIRVKSAFARYSRMENSRHLSGAEAAALMLEREGLGDVKIEMTQGWLSDHYDPRDKTLRLSPDVYNGRTVAAVGVACHEAGHALQHAYGYAPLHLRTILVPVAGFGSSFAWILIIGGIIFQALPFGLMLAKIGVLLFGAAVLFQVVTLPVEFNASSRAKDALVRNGVLAYSEEIEGANAVLNAAALTYVAATIAALAQLLYWMIRLGIIGGRRR
ncbi:MAG: zinc metallopeptidase [Planctomycetota bacterium]